MKFTTTIIAAVICLTSTSVSAQPVEQRIKIIVAPDHTNWLYKKGEEATFSISVLNNGNLVENALVKYEIGAEKMPPEKKGELMLKSGKGTLDGGTMTDPGFLRCIATLEAEGRTYRGLATAGYEPQTIMPSMPTPVNFRQFWDSAKAELAAIPLDAKMILLPERCNSKVNVYELNLQNYGNSRLYGILCVPKAPGKYPALLTVPGAGVRSYYGDTGTASTGVITLDIGIHGIPVTLPEKVYDDLRKGAFKFYNEYNLDNKDRYYYKRVYLGCVRANDFLTSMPEFNGNLGVTGGSQGGALSIITGGLDKRVRAVVSFFPALSDMAGFLKNRANGWPDFFDKNKISFNNTPQKLETISYYDVVNFAKWLTVPIKMSWGFNDEVCPPTSVYAAYNSIQSAKSVELYPDTGHWSYPEQGNKLWQWMMSQIKTQ